VKDTGGMMQVYKKIAYGLLAFSLSYFSGTSNLYAAPLDLSNVPLFSGNGDIPNVFFEIDDSGSMDWEILTRSHWHYCAYDSEALGDVGSDDCQEGEEGLVENGLMGTYNEEPEFDFFHYMYDESDNTYDVACDDDKIRQSYEACSTTDAIDADWRVRSSSVNVIYYNPEIEYSPWQGTGLLDASFAAALSDPQSGTDGFSSMRDLDGFVYEQWEDDKGYTASDGRPRRGTNNNYEGATPNGEVDLWDSHMRFTVGASSIKVEKISYTVNGSTGIITTATSTIKTISSGTDALLGENPDGTDRTVAEVQQNVANWYQYSRRRAFVAKAATASVITNNAGFRYGLSVFENDGDLFTEVAASTNTALLNAFFDFDWPQSSTHLRTGLERVGEYYAGGLASGGSKASPIISECQQNFTILMTDGYWNGDDPSLPVDDADGDGYEKTAADVAMTYYDTDLRSDLDDSVPTNADDLNSRQHMVTFGVAFGVEGHLSDTDNDGWPDPVLAEDGNWGDPLEKISPAVTDRPAKIDDLWHAAFNSKGSYISAKTPMELVDGLDNALGNVESRTSSASAIAANSTTLNTGTALYQALFSSGDWSGDLRKLRVSDGSATSGDVCFNVQRGFVCPTPLWKASDQLASQNFSSGREIISYNPTEKKGIVFDFPSNYDAIVGGSSDATKMDASQITALLVNAPFLSTTAVAAEITDNQSFGNDLVDFFRGDSSNEGTGQNFRGRSSKMEDVINSAPVFVGAPRFRYSDAIESELYSTFKAANANRTEMVYVGSNGMLHGFDASTGNEKLAFLPSAIYENLHELAESNYNHSYFVDGSPSVGDAFFASDTTWRSVLVGGLNAGGKSVYALDVTDPNDFTESNASSLVLWEFFDADLGDTFGTPDVVKMNDGQWAAVFGNGYNNTGTGQAGIFIVNIETGALITKILTGVGDSTTPNGIAHVTPVDFNGDSIVDYIYGGDLQGNLWKFDVSDSNISKWVVAYESGNGSSAVPAPIFTAISPTNGNPQPITSRPTVTTHPDGTKDGFMVYFGTGKYIEVNDNVAANQDTQTFYGIWDVDESNLTVISKANDLLQQNIEFEDGVFFDLDGDGTTDFSREVRVTSAYTVDWDNHLGWYMDLTNTALSPLDNKGERQVTNPIVRNGRVIFTTLQPAQSTCSFGGSSWLMELDAESGSHLPTPPFDLNNDGLLDDKDAYVASGGGLTPPGGVRFDGIITMPRILGGGDLDFKNFGTSASQNVSTIGEDSGENLGRASWRQLLR